MIVVLEQDSGLRLQRVRPRDRVRAHVRVSALDHDLAAGACPDSNVAARAPCGASVWILAAPPPRPEPDTRCGRLGDPREMAPEGARVPRGGTSGTSRA